MNGVSGITPFRDEHDSLLPVPLDWRCALKHAVAGEPSSHNQVRSEEFTN
jgi:hypothetical protein